MKRRTLADMAPFELLLLVTLGDIIQQGITQEDYSVTGAVLAVSTFAFWITVLTYVTWRWRGRRRSSTVSHSSSSRTATDRPTFAAERLPVDEVLEAARQNGIDTLDKVASPCSRRPADLVHPPRERRRAGRARLEVTPAEVATTEVAAAEITTAEVTTAKVATTSRRHRRRLVDDRRVAVTPTAETARQHRAEQQTR